MEATERVLKVRLIGYKCRVAGGDAVLKSVDILTPKRACLSDSSQGGGKDCHGARDCFSEGDRNPPMTGVVGFSKETTLALLPRMHMEELQSELNRRNIVVKLAGEHQRGRGDLEHVLREVMTREYEVEGDEGMDTTNTSSAFVHCSSNTSSAFQHCSQLGQVLLRPNNNQASLQNAPELSQPTEKGQASSRQAAEASSTNTCPGQVQVKKESNIVYDFEQHTNSVAGVTEPSTSQTQYPGIVHGSQSNCARSQNLIVKIKTEPGLEEETEGEQLQDLRSEFCPSSLGQLSQELDMVDVSTEEGEDDKPSTSSEEPVQLWEIQGQQLHQGEPEPVAAQGSQKRFASLDTKQLNELEDLELTVHNTTVRSTRWGAKIFKEWLQARGLDTAFERLPPDVLAVLLRQFYGEVRKDDGTPYAKGSYGGLRAAIHRHLTGPPYNCKYNILKNKEFQAANNVYYGVIRQLKRDGLDARKSYPPILASDITKMFETKTLGVDNPVALQRLVFFYVSFYLCQRGKGNLRDLKVGDFVLNTEGGRKYYTLKYYEHQKNHPDRLPENQPSPRLYESPNDTRPCPVQAFELYCSKLHNRCPYLFQRPSTQWEPGCHTSEWYYCEPVGHNKLATMMRDISKAAGLSKPYTNHSVTVTAIKALDKAGFESRVIMSLSGHRAEASVHRWKQGSRKRPREACSDALGAALGLLGSSVKTDD